MSEISEQIVVAGGRLAEHDHLADFLVAMIIAAVANDAIERRHQSGSGAKTRESADLDQALQRAFAQLAHIDSFAEIGKTAERRFSPLLDQVLEGARAGVLDRAQAKANGAPTIFPHLDVEV